MNNVDKEYFRLLNEVLTNGRRKKNRTGIDTIGVFGAQAKFDIQMDAFPVLTTKKVHFPAILHELLWFIKGDTNIKYLVDNNVRIWNEWAYKRYITEYKNLVTSGVHNAYTKGYCAESNEWVLYIQDEFVQKIKEDSEFAKQWGELGEGTYGGMWRAFPYAEHWALPEGVSYDGNREGYSLKTVDQLQKVVNKLKTNPDDRRIIVSAWHPHWVDHCALPPCHCMFHFNTEEMNQRERFDLYWKSGGKLGWTSVPEMNEKVLNEANVPTRRLNCLLYQRSCDAGLGIPFNISSYCLLTALVAHSVNMVPGVFTHTYGDLHIYENHIEQLKLQLTREPMTLPKLWINPKVRDLFSFKYDDIKLIDYVSHPTIKMDVAV